MHGGSVTFDIVAVTVLHIEINEVNKTQSVEVTIHEFDSLIDAVSVALGGVGFRKSLASEKIVDLAYGNHVKAFCLKQIEHR